MGIPICKSKRFCERSDRKRIGNGNLKSIWTILVKRYGHLALICATINAGKMTIEIADAWRLFTT